MKKRVIYFSSLIYILIAALSLVYEYYFVKTLYFKPYLHYYDLYFNIHTFAAIPALYFSVAAFLAIVVYVLIPATIAKAFRKYLFGIAGLILLVYLIVTLFTLIGLNSFSAIAAILPSHPISFSVLGILFALGAYKKQNSESRM